MAKAKRNVFEGLQRFGKNEVLRKALKTEHDLAIALLTAISVAKTNQLFAHLLAADTLSFLTDIGYYFEEDLSKKISGIDLVRDADPISYKKLKESYKVPANAKIELRPSRELLKRSPLRQPIAKLVSEAKKSDDQHALNFLLTPQSNAHPLSHASAQFALTPALPEDTEANLATAGWDVVIQIRDSYYEEFSREFFANSFFAAALINLFTGESETDLVEQAHVFNGWFLMLFKVKLTMDIENPPRIILAETAPNHIRLAIPAVSEVQVRAQSNDPWGPTVENNITIIATARVEKRNSVSFGRELLENIFVADMANADVSVVFEQEVAPDSEAWLSAFITWAAVDFLNQEIPAIPVSPELPDARPVMFYDQARAWVGNFDRGLNTFSIGWGEGEDPFPNFILWPEHNIGLGLSPALVHFNLRRNLPNLPVINGRTQINDLSLELKPGRIEIRAKGRRDISWWFDADFDLRVSVFVSVDDEGLIQAEARAEDLDVDGWWVTVVEVMLPIIGTIAFKIGESIAEGFAVDELNDRLNINLDIQNRFDAEGPISVIFDGVQITRNGLFFQGNVTADFPLEV